ncbi:MAG: ABC transporter ATP-binding protein [Chloroflexi bacterium]|nr:ABC transporter ATP-binding protein [Chloroflexota bacterium]
MAPILQVKNLKTYFYTDDGVVKAVDGISYDLERGETLGLVGESGCGKSVSALSLMRLIPSPPGKIVEGEAYLEGTDLLKLSSEEMRRRRGKDIAMIFQEPMTSLNPVLTIGRQITEALEVHLKMNRKTANQRAAELLEEVGMPDAKRRLNDYPHHLSGGMRQRVMIAMALSCEPKVLLADEPTTAVDVTIQAQLLDLIHRLSKERGTAVVIITHNLGVVARYADRVNVMYAGRIVESSTAAKVYANPGHPYTLGLLRSVPRLDEARGERLIPIEGMPPDLAHKPQGCAFRPRCSFAIPTCREKDPQLMPVDQGHYAACWVDIRASKGAEG